MLDFFGNVWIKGLFASLFLHNNMQPVIFLIKVEKPQWLALLSSVCLTISLVYNFLSEE